MSLEAHAPRLGEDERLLLHIALDHPHLLPRARGAVEVEEALALLPRHAAPVLEDRVPAEHTLHVIGARELAVPASDGPVPEPEVEDGERRDRERCGYFQLPVFNVPREPDLTGVVASCR